MAIEITQVKLPEDTESLNRICALTALNGGNVEDLVNDAKLPGGYFSLPYAHYDPSLCLMLRSNTGESLGFIVATDDTAEYAQWFNTQWLPGLRESCREFASSPRSDYERELLDLIHRDMEVLDFCEKYPAHLHIDILPGTQGKGFGKRLMHECIDRLTQRGVPGVHLGVSAKNERAIGFYQLFGFSLIGWRPGVRYYGMKL